MEQSNDGFLTFILHIVNISEKEIQITVQIHAYITSKKWQPMLHLSSSMIFSTRRGRY